MPRPKVPKGKELKDLRTEADRTRFKQCYQQKDFDTSPVVTEMVPDFRAEQDDFPMTYGTALTRSAAE